MNTEHVPREVIENKAAILVSQDELRLLISACLTAQIESQSAEKKSRLHRMKCDLEELYRAAFAKGGE